MAGAGSVRRRAYSLESGDRIGPYVCVRPLAMGGMAELHVVAEAEQGERSELSVVKCMLPHLAADPEFATMFLKEARLARGLDHPNITRLLDCGEDEGDFYIVLEYVHGYDLRHLVRAVAKSDAALPLGLAVGIALEVCRGLHHAHEHADDRGRPLALVHRDVTPSNVLLGLDGRVLLTDFGIARALTTMKTTRAGVIKGKLGYMSPEQCRDSHLDRRSDIFSVGVLLYEMTTGFRMFHAGNDFAVLNKIAKGEYVPPDEATPGFPERLAEIIASCVAVEPSERPKSARALEDMLGAFVRDEGLSVDPRERAAFVRETLGDKSRPEVVATEPSVEPDARAPLSAVPRRRPWGFVAALAIGGVAGGAAVLASSAQRADAPASLDAAREPAPESSQAPESVPAEVSEQPAGAEPNPEDPPLAVPSAKPPSASSAGVDPEPQAEAASPSPVAARPTKKRRKRKPSGGARDRDPVGGASDPAAKRTILPPSMRGK